MARRRRERTARRALGDLIFQLSGLAGLALGFMWAFNRPAAEAPKSCESAGSEIGECFGDALLDQIAPYLLGMGVGLLAGAFVGAMVSRRLNRPSRIAA